MLVVSMGLTRVSPPTLKFSPCQSWVDYGNTKITQHALKVSESVRSVEADTTEEE